MLLMNVWQHIRWLIHDSSQLRDLASFGLCNSLTTQHLRTEFHVDLLPRIHSKTERGGRALAKPPELTFDHEIYQVIPGRSVIDVQTAVITDLHLVPVVFGKNEPVHADTLELFPEILPSSNFLISQTANSWVTLSVPYTEIVLELIPEGVLLLQVHQPVTNLKEDIVGQQGQLRELVDVVSLEFSGERMQYLLHILGVLSDVPFEETNWVAIYVNRAHKVDWKVGTCFLSCYPCGLNEVSFHHMDPIEGGGIFSTEDLLLDPKNLSEHTFVFPVIPVKLCTGSLLSILFHFEL